MDFKRIYESSSYLAKVKNFKNRVYSVWKEIKSNRQISFIKISATFDGILEREYPDKIKNRDNDEFISVIEDFMDYAEETNWDTLFITIKPNGEQPGIQINFRESN